MSRTIEACAGWQARNDDSGASGGDNGGDGGDGVVSIKGEG